MTKNNGIEAQTTRFVRRLNDLYIGTSVTLAALALQREQIEGGKKHWINFTVPSGGERASANIRRNQKQMTTMIDQMIAGGERSKALLVAVSIAEDYLLNVLKLLLRAYPARMNRGIRGGETETAVPLAELLSKDREDILEERIQARLNRALYSSPADYLTYLRDVLEIDIPEERSAQFIEIKASRDIIIHANGRINDKYLEKSGDLARGAVGDPLPVDQDYFDRSIAAMKLFMFDIGRAIDAKYGQDEIVKACLLRFDA